MQAIWFVLDCVGLFLVIIWAARNADCGDKPATGLFSFREEMAEAPPVSDGLLRGRQLGRPAGRI